MAHTPLNALNEFLTVARRGSFTAAAAELGISASALSQAVKQLEERLGVALLTRTTRSVAPTAAGRRLLEQAGPGVSQALAALGHAADQSGELGGTIRLTVTPLALTPVEPLTALLARFALAHPRVTVEIVVENRMRDVVADGFDAGVRLGEFLERDMVAVQLTSAARWTVVAAPAYLERHGTLRHPRDLLHHNCIGYRSPNTGELYPWELDRGKRTLRVPTRGSIVTNDERVMLAMCEAGVGLFYALEDVVAPLIAAGRLCAVLEDYVATGPGFFLYFPSRAQVSPAFRALLAMVPRRGRAPGRR